MNSDMANLKAFRQCQCHEEVGGNNQQNRYCHG